MFLGSKQRGCMQPTPALSSACRPMNRISDHRNFCRNRLTQRHAKKSTPAHRGCPSPATGAARASAVFRRASCWRVLQRRFAAVITVSDRFPFDMALLLWSGARQVGQFPRGRRGFLRKFGCGISPSSPAIRPRPDPCFSTHQRVEAGLTVRENFTQRGCVKLPLLTVSL